MTVPQTAAWNIYQAVLGGDPSTIEDALSTGLHKGRCGDSPVPRIGDQRRGRRGGPRYLSPGAAATA